MSLDYINEAFRALNYLNEDMFKTSAEGINNLTTFMNAEDDSIQVIDPYANDEEDLEDSYIGKVIVTCNVCHSHVFKDKEEIDITEDDVANIGDACPYCGEEEGFTIIGEIAPYGTEINLEDDEDIDNEDIDTDETMSDEDVELDSEDDEDDDEELGESLNEDFKEVSITTDDQHLMMSSDDNGKVTVTTEPISGAEETNTADAQLQSSDAESGDEIITPLSDETLDRIEATEDAQAAAVEDQATENNEETTEESSDESTDETTAETTEESSEETTEETTDESEDVSFDEVDEESTDELGESYMKRIYENVESFKTTSCSTTPTKLIIEGIITFKSGSKKKTGFMFEAKDMTSNGKLRFIGTNPHFTNMSEAYTLVGKVDSSKLVFESLKYNHVVDGSHVRGVIRKGV